MWTPAEKDLVLRLQEERSRKLREGTIVIRPQTTPVRDLIEEFRRIEERCREGIVQP